MNRRLLTCLLATCSMAAATAQTTIEVGHVTPVKFEKRDGRVKILSYIKLDQAPKTAVSAKLDGTDLKFTTTSSADSLIAWLPLIGEKNELSIYGPKKELLADKAIVPIIPSDWGYFSNGTIHIIQSSHQDIGWMDTPAYCREDRIEGIIIPALNLMKENKDVTFEMEQTLNLMEFLDAYPERKQEVIDHYKNGRFFWGATYNQPYEGLQSGEQLVRQTYFGRKWIKENLPGCDDRTANNMDVPGRSLQLPQILAKSGVTNLFVSRMREGLYNWYSPDGSKVLTFTPGNYGWATLKWKFLESDALTAYNRLHHRSILWSEYFKKHNIPPHYAVLMSCDATKPVDYKELIAQWNQIAAIAEVPLPRIKNSTSEEYFAEVNTKDADFEKVSGERPNLWLYIHGPAHYQATLAKRHTGVLLPAAEGFSAIDGIITNNLKNYPKKTFDRAWMASIYPDHGLGGNNGEITDAIFEDSLKTAKKIGEELLGSALNSIASNVEAKNNAVVIFNDLSWVRSDIASVEISAAQATNAVIKNTAGKVVPSQIVKDGDTHKIVFIAQDVPSMGYNTYYLESGKSVTASPEGVKQLSNYYENQFYKVIFGNGGIRSLYDKKLGKELLMTNKYSGGDIIEAGYLGHGAGEFTQIRPISVSDISSLSSQTYNWKMVESGPIYSLFEATVKSPNATNVTKVKIYHNLKKIDFNVGLIDFNGAHNRQYRFTMPVNMENAKINYEVPMGMVEVGKDEMKTRPGGWGWDGTYTALPEDSHPREILNFISANGSGFGLTMSSSVAVADWVDPATDMAYYPVLQGIMISTHKSCHGAGNWYHQTGSHNFDFSISSHPEGWENGYQFGVAANHPLHAIKKIGNAGALPSSESFVKVSDPFVAISVVKRADNDNNIIIRLVEMKGVDKNVTLEFPIKVKNVIRTNMIEDEDKSLNLSGNSITLPIGHNSIDTYKFIF